MQHGFTTLCFIRNEIIAPLVSIFPTFDGRCVLLLITFKFRKLISEIFDHLLTYSVLADAFLLLDLLLRTVVD